MNLQNTAPGSRINNLCIQALRFGSDLADPTEQNRRRSIATLRILRLRIGQRWPKSAMHQCASYLFASPYRGDGYLSPSLLKIMPRYLLIGLFLSRKDMTGRFLVTSLLSSSIIRRLVPYFSPPLNTMMAS